MWTGFLDPIVFVAIGELGTIPRVSPTSCRLPCITCKIVLNVSSLSAAMANDDPYSFFKASQDLRQDSPFLFIIVMEAFNVLLIRTKDLQLLGGSVVGERGDAVEMVHVFFAETRYLVNLIFMPY